jgi:hypothetical protein
MKPFLQVLLIIAVIFASALVADMIAPLKQLTVYLAEHLEPYLGITIVMSVVGWLFMIGVFAYTLWANGRPMTGEEARDFMRSSTGARVLKGRMGGREARMVASFAEIKDAVRTGAWLREPAWRPLFVGLFAMPCICVGMFGFVFVIGPPLVKLLCSGALVYVAARMAWAFWRA